MSIQGGHTFVFDIETIAVCLDDLPDSVQEYLLRFSDGTAQETDAVQHQMALWAPTNTIIAIGVYCVETKTGAVYFQAGGQSVDFEKEGIRYVSGDEAFVLTRFWQVMTHAGRFVTFNGRGFDCPVLLLRSAMLGVAPTMNIMPYRYNSLLHVDLLEQFTFYNTTRKFSLDLYCRSFGIPSPKIAMNGHDLPMYFREGKYVDIATYCMGDVLATVRLFEYWQKYLSFRTLS